jgi:hypothetical protein
MRFGLDGAQPRMPGDELGKWREAGYGYLVRGGPGGGDAHVERFAREVTPELVGREEDAPWPTPL